MVKQKQNKSFLKKLRWLHLILIIIICSGLIAFFTLNKITRIETDFNSNLPICPTNLSGLLTTRVMDNGKIDALVPLGNSNPPGHTYPVDHIYFQSNTGVGKWNVYTPGSGIVIKILEQTGYDDSGSIMRQSITITIGLCQGVSIVIASPGELSANLKSAIEKSKKNCKKFPGKHQNEKSIESCEYYLEYIIKAGDLIALTDNRTNEMPEVWALDHNKKISGDIDWDRYGNDYYPYAFCFFDLYSGYLKSEYYSLFGSLDNVGRSNLENKTIKDEKTGKIIYDVRTFIPRTIEPLCGQIIQNVKGTVQGDWFGLPKGSNTFPGNNIGDLALIHDNVDPRIAKIVIAGNIANSGIVMFIPVHEGKLNREFSEVKSDENIYCYQEDSRNGWSIGGKVILQLIDDHHMKVEHQDGNCTDNESFKNPFTYDR